ncbi:hypothetical protein M1P56_15745 [Streptomyces sp. HU2014]|uniref:hypothetical protein n=1 Tax=Streptomyces sp. HU2014 TaxID=2939414 RepID=UPI00200D0D82|nr:hypothetical protein [Streptomyces sp. HU2014]UQI45704.1 hypothetical protein M1P56_15745 [Streptomyces sp. HU2014]
METRSASADAFPDSSTLEKRLDTFLEQRGVSREAVLKEADQGMGTPALAVAAGSVLAGFGNHRSDLDLLVLVENDRLTRFPIQSHEHGTLIDVGIRRASTVRDSTAELAAGAWPRFATVTEDAWNHRRRALNTANRLALGLPLTASPPWDDWHARLRGPWLAEAVEQWWTVEAHRLAQAARWLLDARPMAAAVRAREAVVAALNARAAVGGELYFAAKWVGEKLKALGDTEGLALLRDALAPPLAPREHVAHHLAAVERLTGAAAPLHAVLRWSTGVGATVLDDRTVVDRWQLRALEVPRRDLPPGDSGAVVWSGPAGAFPPDDLLTLFVHDMVWLGLAHPDPEVPA